MLQAINSFIPIQSGQAQFIKTQGDLMSNLLGQIGYEVEGGFIVFTEDITALGINNVMIKLVTTDFSKLSDYDILPCPADFENAIIQTVFRTMAAQLKSDRIDDPLVEESSTVKTKP